MLPRLLTISFLAAVFSACSPMPTPMTKKNEPGPMKPYPEIQYERGPAANAPKDTLLAWLVSQVDADGSPKRVRMPVTIRFRDDGMGIAGGTVGALDITLSDSSLGVSLADHVRRECADRAAGCSMHLVGRWQTTPRSDAEALLFGKGPVFVLWRVHGKTPAGVDYLEVEKSPS
jgi:hypothetical protein